MPFLPERETRWNIQIQRLDTETGKYVPIDEKDIKKFNTRDGLSVLEMGINLNARVGGMVELKVENLDLAKGSHLEVSREKDRLGNTKVERNIIGETILTSPGTVYQIVLSPGRFVAPVEIRDVESILIQQSEDKMPQNELRISISRQNSPSSNIPRS